MSDAVARLSNAGVRPSLVRIKILEYLMGTRAHPTVEDIFEALRPEIPTISRTTVYNALDLFTEKGVIRTLTIEERRTRYDATTMEHGHFICSKCGSVTDFDYDFSDMKLPAGYDMSSRELFVYGVCPACAGSIS